MRLRTGIGYDVHPFTPDRSLVLGGVTIPHEFGLLGHSDADVLLHAVCDAMLGAAALGDIGQHFPPTDAAWKAIDSSKLLMRVVAMVSESGFKVENIDATIIAEAPRIMPYALSMRTAIASIVRIEIAAVSVKATTNEGLGFIGRQEGIAAIATCLLISQ